MHSRLTFPALALALSAVMAGCAPDNTAVSGRAPAPAALALDPQNDEREPGPARVVPGEFLVKFKAGTSRDHIARTLAKVTPSTVRGFKALPGLRRVKLSSDVSPDAFAAMLDQSGQIEYVEPNFIVHAYALPNDPDFARQWNLHHIADFGVPDSDIDAPEAWDTTTGSNDVVIGVIDSGVDYTHVDLAANIFSNPAECTANALDDDGNGYVDDCHGINAITGGSDPMDDRGHGTHVAGIIGAVGNNGIGVAGVAWNVRILPCKFIGDDGSGSTADAIACLDYMADLKDRGVNIVATNNSWGGLEESRALRDAIATHRQRGMLFVAAAGNGGDDNDLLPSFPCSYFAANILCVGATDAGDIPPRFSNFGRGAVHLSAPGEGILSTVPGNGYDHNDGTSMAAPHVAGAVALLAAQNPARDWRATKNLLIASGDLLPFEFPTRSQSGRRLNVARALSCTNSVIFNKLQPLTPIEIRTGGRLSTFRRAIGTPIALSALHINCAAGNGPVNVSVAPTGDLITLHDDGVGIDEAAGDGIYSATWTPQSAGTFVLSFDGTDATPVTIEVDARLKPGFPQPMTAVDFTYDQLGSAFGGSTVVGNIDADASLEILATGVSYGPLYAWRHDGSSVTGWPSYVANSIFFPSLGELDGDPDGLEVATHVGFLGFTVLDGDGAMLPGWPRDTGLFYASAATIDVDGDGRDEIIDYPARRADGSLLSPLRPVPDAGPFAGPASTADLDGDGEADFISVYSRTLWASSRNGMLAGFPAHSDLEMGPSASTNVVIGDVDGDGHLEIVTVAYESPDWLGTVLIFSDAGKLERTLPCNSRFPSTPALADLDGDGIPEIVVSTDAEVYAWKGSGALAPGWPVSLGVAGGGGVEPVVGDVDGDGQPDVVVVLQQFDPYRSARIHILDRHGNPHTGFPMSLDTSTGMIPPAIADLDLDGRNDLVVVTSPDWGRRDGVFAFDWHGAGPYGAIEWDQHLGGAHHRGYYELGKNLSQDAYLTTLAHGEGSITAANADIQCGADCIQRYPKGTSVTLTATPTAQGRFNRWLGACAGHGNPCTIAIQRYTRVAAQFDSPLSVTLLGAGSGTVTSNPAGISCPGDCGEIYDARTVVTLTAMAASNSSFDGWGGACSGKSPTCTVPIDRAQSVSAKFVTQYRLDLLMTGTGTGRVTSQPAGIDCGTQCAADFDVNASVTLTVVPAADSTFTGWTVPCPSYLSTSCTVTMNEARTLTATFARKTVLDVGLTGAGHGRVRTLEGGIFCGPTCTAMFDSQTITQAIAEPEFDSYFVEWSGACSGGNLYCTLIMDRDRSTSARFALKPVLRVTANGSGRVQSGDAQILCENGSCQRIYDPGMPVVLTATPAANAAFMGWSGGCTGQATTCNLTLNSSIDVTATFSTTTGNGPPPTSPGGGSGGGGGSHGMLELLLLLSFASRARRTRGLDPMTGRRAAVCDGAISN
jgi:subtilisin family serine protease